MPHHIQEDWKEFQDITGGQRREELKKFTKTGQIFGQRPNGRGKISIPIKRIELPYITYGQPKDGVGSGPGKPGDVIGKTPDKGKNGNKPGTDPGEGMLVDVDMEDVWKELQEELKLPNLQPKDTPTYDEIKIKYNGISRIGPRSLLHTRRTLKETLKREIAYHRGDLPKKMVPGVNQPVQIFHPLKEDFRFRQYNEIKQPSSNAAIFFLRDGSGSMDDAKCEIVSDISFWIDAWVRRFYKETQKIYVWHDTEAKELSEKEFYSLRYGGGTNATCSLKFVAKQLKFRIRPEKWNIYIFYFGDGETFGSDNKEFATMLQNELGPRFINMTGITEILSSGYMDSLKDHVDKCISSGKLDSKFVRTTEVGSKEGRKFGQVLTPEERGMAVKKAIQDLLGVNQKPVEEKVA